MCGKDTENVCGVCDCGEEFFEPFRVCSSKVHVFSIVGFVGDVGDSGKVPESVVECFEVVDCCCVE